MNFKYYTLMSEKEALDIAEKLVEWKKGMGRSERATQALKNNLEIIDNELSNKITHSIVNNYELITDHMVKTVFPPKFNKYETGGEYKRHTDAALMGGSVRTDLACTIFFSSPFDFVGGDLIIEGISAGKGAPGQCVVYPCHLPHWVTPIIKGERIAAITWFESMYRDLEKRELMSKFLKTLNSMEQFSEQHTSLASIHGKLQRMWIE